MTLATMNDSGLERVAVSMRPAVRDYLSLLRRTAGEDFVALTVFGPVLMGDFAQSNEPADNVLVLKRIHLNMLRTLAERGPDLGSRRIAAPLVMTPESISEKLDSFPLELLEIQQWHATIAGEDYFANLSLQHDHMRLQVERELKRILLRMRQGLLESAGVEEFLEELEHDIGRHAIRTLRGLLWLKGQKDFLPAEQAQAACEKLAGRALPGLRASLRPGVGNAWQEFQEMYADIEALAGIANDL